MTGYLEIVPDFGSVIAPLRTLKRELSSVSGLCTVMPSSLRALPLVGFWFSSVEVQKKKLEDGGTGKGERRKGTTVYILRDS